MEGLNINFFPKTERGWVMLAPKKGERRLSEKAQTLLGFTPLFFYLALAAINRF
jgi:hypothetical protein